MLPSNLDKDGKKAIKKSLKLRKRINIYLKHYRENAAGIPVETEEVNRWDEIFFGEMNQTESMKIFYISARANLPILMKKQTQYLKKRREKESENSEIFIFIPNWEEFEKEEWQNAVAESLFINIFH